MVYNHNSIMNNFIIIDNVIIIKLFQPTPTHTFDELNCDEYSALHRIAISHGCDVTGVNILAMLEVQC
jgi:hypothetical protein